MFMSDPDFVEPIARFRIMYHEDLPPEHKAQYRLRGINPDDLWSLEWSFDDEAAGREQLAECIDRAARWGKRTYKMVDARDTLMQIGAQDFIDGVHPADPISGPAARFPRRNEQDWWHEGFRAEAGI